MKLWSGTRDLKYVDVVYIVFPLDEFQVCYIFTENKDKTWLPMANTKPWLLLVFCEYMEDPTTFVFILPPTNTSLNFFLSSAVVCKSKFCTQIPKPSKQLQE